MKRTLMILLMMLMSLTSLGLGLPAQSPKVSPRLQRVYDSVSDDERLLIWVYFADKGESLEAKYQTVRQTLTLKSRQRRLTVRTPDRVIDFDDLPVESSYLVAVEQRVECLRHSSKWLNAVSAVATKRQIAHLATLDFVKTIDLVARARRQPDPAESEGRRAESGERKHAPRTTHHGKTGFDYGPAFDQVQQINVPAVHDLGNYGQGVVIGVFDAGFNRLDHECFRNMTIIAKHDFVNGDDDVADGQDMGRSGSHGTGTLSTLGCFAEGKLIGPAFGASYILAKTENDNGTGTGHPETPVEEDNWVAALEWAEGMGVDIISSSLGYLDFDPPFQGYTWQDMDGRTATITRAAVMAVERGIVVVNSAGNNGIALFNPSRNTLGAPADGDGVVSVGAVDAWGNRAGFSSVGPTVDGRIKPDVAAQGLGVRVASARGMDDYGSLSGTSFSCPLVAGVAALVLREHPNWSPRQVLDALRQTASQASNPDNRLGWGIVNALEAVKFSSQ
jgi:subtilisin family serine protease